MPFILVPSWCLLTVALRSLSVIMLDFKKNNLSLAVCGRHSEAIVVIYLSQRLSLCSLSEPLVSRSALHL